MYKVILIMIMSMTVAIAQANSVGIAATVNGQDVRTEKLQKAVDAHLQQQGTNVGAIRDPKKYKKVREEVLDVLIGQNLLWQSAEKDKLVASDEEVDKLYQQFMSQYPDKDAFLNRMKAEGYTEKSYRLELKHQLSAKKWVHENVIKKISVDEKEIHDFYTKNEQKFMSPETVHARHILVSVDEKASKKDKQKARKLLSKLKKQLAKGADFSELAKKHSTGPSGPQGGDLGYFTRGKMVKPFEEAAFKLKPGEVSGIVETRFGFHLIKVEEKQAPRKVKEEEVAGRIEQYLLRTKSEAGLNQAIDKLKKTAKIEKYNF